MINQLNPTVTLLSDKVIVNYNPANIDFSTAGNVLLTDASNLRYGGYNPYTDAAGCNAADMVLVAEGKMPACAITIDNKGVIEMHYDKLSGAETIDGIYQAPLTHGTSYSLKLTAKMTDGSTQEVAVSFMTPTTVAVASAIVASPIKGKGKK